MPQPLLPFEDFLSHLQQQGFALGVDDFLQIQTLLNRMPKDCPPEKLKPLMCPLVASNEAEQMLFYRAFDRYFADLALKHEELTKENPPSHSPLNEIDEELQRYQKYGEELNFTFGDFLQKYYGFILLVLFQLGLMVYAFFPTIMSSNERKLVLPVLTIDIREWLAFLFVGTGVMFTTYFLFQKGQYPSVKAFFHKQGLLLAALFPLFLLAYSFVFMLADKHLRESMDEIFVDVKTWTCILGVCLAFTCFGIYRFWRKKEDSFYLDTLENLPPPPHYWNIQVPKSELNLARSQAFNKAANRLQKRRLIPTKKVDVLETVEATIAAAGFPNFKYLQTSVLPEYLLLIDQSSTKDQQTKWFDMWFEALKEREVIVHRFFYHGNPEWCWDAEKNYVSLADLQHRFGECRLVLIPTPLCPSKRVGKQNIYSSPPLEGIEGRFGVFSDWQEKILLSTNLLPKPVAEYLEEESGFVVLPAKMESLHQLSDIFEGETPIASNTNVYPTSISTDLEKLSALEAIVELKQKLTDVGFKCLCAAAMYPEMNWDLTVYLGETLHDERELLKEENMLPLVSLPYFRKGFIPEDLRKELTKELDEDSKRLVKGAILHLLQLHPLVGDEYSAEFFDYQLHIALHDAQLHPEDKHKLSTLQHLTEQQEFEESSYKQVILRYLQMADRKLALGENFGKWFQKEDGGVLTVNDSTANDTTSKPTSRISSSQKKSTEPKKKSSGIYLYPKVSLLIRAFTAVFTLILIVFLLMCFFMFLWLVTQSFKVSLFISFLVYLFCLTLDSRKLNSDNSRRNRKNNALMVVDIHTNKRCVWWQSILRRGFLTFITAGFILTITLSKGISGFLDGGGFRTEGLVIPIGLWGINLLMLLLEVRGRKIGDYLTGTQVIYEADYQEGNFQIKRKGRIQDEKKTIQE